MGGMGVSTCRPEHLESQLGAQGPLSWPLLQNHLQQWLHHQLRN